MRLQYPGPLFYEAYPGSIVDVSRLQHTLKKAKSYGHEHIGFALDKGGWQRRRVITGHLAVPPRQYMGGL